MLAAVTCGCKPPGPACELSPPRGPFDGDLQDAPGPASIHDMPQSAEDAVRMQPGRQHRWDPSIGLVEAASGRLTLHGIARAPAAGEVVIAVLRDYQPVPARISVWDGERKRIIAARDGSEAPLWAKIESPQMAFDIEVEGAVKPGQWREVQTVVAIQGATADVRRWTTYAGVSPPTGVSCRTVEETARGGSRIADGTLHLVAPRAADIAMVGVGTAVTQPGFVRFDRAKTVARMPTGNARIAAVWESPMSGPGRTWISTFWTMTTVPPGIMR